MRKVVLLWALGVLSFAVLSLSPGLLVVAQEEPELERPAPPALDDFEADENDDGVPDGWYNGRDVELVAKGGKVGPTFSSSRWTSRGGLHA